MSVTFQEIGIGALALSQMGVLTVAVKALARRKTEDARHAAVDAERVVCPVTMNGFKAVLENLLAEQREYIREQREHTAALKEIAVHLEVLRDREAAR
jgi:hypothetical protein